jgi:hypothetical protein
MRGKFLKAACLLLAVTLACGATACDKKQPEPDSGVKTEVSGNMKTYDLKNIEYKLSEAVQKSNPRQVSVSLPPLPSFSTGEEVTAGVHLHTTLATVQNPNVYYYAIIDWGDGSWTYNGPYESKEGVPSLSHAYKTAGEYSVKAAAVNIADGKLYGWSAEETLSVSGSYFAPAPINRLKPFSSSINAKSDSLESILDGKIATKVKTGEAADSSVEEYIGFMFDDWYSLDRLEIQFPTGEEYFPSNIAVEYTTDGGETWYSLPKYYYLYDYEVGRHLPLMRFPNPLGATLSLPMNGIAANGVRLSAKLFLMEERTLAISEMRAYGDKELLLYTGKGGTFDADLNNMWTIFGSAATEPIVSGSIANSRTNPSPFRTGYAEILSTEWAEWNGLKFNWTGETAAKEAYLNQLVNIRYGSDGWSADDGYIWATADSPKHLGEQNHYTLNPIFIIAARNYLLSGNQTQVTQNGEVVDFMDAKNRSGQTMGKKLEKAMSYMLNTLDGKNGILTIFDPENDGTTKGNASNYWDTHRAFGFKSAYENALFYASLVAMADIKEYYGETAEVQKYNELAAKSKDAYNKLFWDDAKGRYITSVNVNGDRIDFGMTMVNYYAVAYGLADKEKAERIYEWLDGKRIIEGDTSTGADIYGEFVYASRSNTVDVSSTGAPYYWWDHGGQLPCTPGTFGGYGHQMQNGGTIFYISYYDMLGRLSQIGADSAAGRFNVIMDEFHKDSLRRNRYMSFVQNGSQGVGEYSEGVIGEFPESGLVPLTFVTGFLGLNPCAQGLKISPKLPADYDFAGVREYRFGNRVYSIQADKNASAPEVKTDGNKYFVRVPADKEYVITLDNRLMEVKGA